MNTYINIYFYRIDQASPRNVISSWRGCVAVPRQGDTVALGEGGDISKYRAEEVAWSQPGGHAGPQIVDILVSDVN